MSGKTLVVGDPVDGVEGQEGDRVEDTEGAVQPKGGRLGPGGAAFLCQVRLRRKRFSIGRQ